MPIKFQCTCGHVLTVPDNAAGKSGKCPKCQATVKVPVPKATAPASAEAKDANTAKSAAAKPVSAKPAAVKPAAAKPAMANKTAAGASAQPAAAVGVMDSLLEEAGLTRRKGPVCPKCAADIRPGAVVCVSCGLKFESGESLTGFNAQSSRPEFDNIYLQEASDNMVRDTVMDLRRDRASMPWWVIMSFLIGAVTLAAAGVVIVDGKFGEPAPEGEFIGKLQRLQVFTTLGLTVLVTGLANVLFAHLSITFFGFTKSVVQGLACFFFPIIYSVPYGIMNWGENKAPVKAIMMASLFIGFGVFLIVRGDGFAKVQGLF